MDAEFQILLVEDDPRDVQLTVRELRVNDSSTRIQVARDGEEALEILLGDQGHRDGWMRSRPHLILLDLKLPKLDGLQVLREIKSRPETRVIPVVALTSSGEEQDKINCYNLGVNGYVQKPVQFEQFRSTMHAVGLYWLQINQPPPGKMLSYDR